LPRRKSLSDAAIAALKPRPKGYTVPDPELPGHYLRVRPTGAKSFVAVARAPHGKQLWHTIGSASLYTIGEARGMARDAIKAIRAGADRSPSEAFEAVAAQWLKRHVDAKGLRTRDAITRCLDNHLLPAWSGREFIGLRRADVAKLLDHVQDSAGPQAADFALAVMRNIANWYATRHDDYASPVVRGMRRTDAKKRARARILDDDELRAVWKQAEANGTFGNIIKLALLTAQRREKIASMKWPDVTVDGVWTITAEAREKGNAGELALPEAAIEIIKAQPRFGSNVFVFAGRGDGHFNGFSKAKRALDAKVKIAPWVVHDLRRTARSLMARAGVRPDVAERVMGHAIRGVEGIYDRHQYRDAKADAVRRLSGLIETIINPPVGNVVPLKANVGGER
jgi:integrase